MRETFLLNNFIFTYQKYISLDLVFDRDRRIYGKDVKKLIKSNGEILYNLHFSLNWIILFLPSNTSTKQPITLIFTGVLLNLQKAWVINLKKKKTNKKKKKKKLEVDTSRTICDYFAQERKNSLIIEAEQRPCLSIIPFRIRETKYNHLLRFWLVSHLQQVNVQFLIPSV